MSDAKEKAIEFYWLYYNQIEHHLDAGVDHDLSIVCASLAVKEIIKFCNSCSLLNNGKESDKIWGFWNEVLSELKIMRKPPSKGILNE